MVWWFSLKKFFNSLIIILYYITLHYIILRYIIYHIISSYHISYIILLYAFCLFICGSSPLILRYVNCIIASYRTTQIKLHLLSKCMTLIDSRALKGNLAIAEPTCSSVNNVFNRILFHSTSKLKFYALQCGKICIVYI